MRKTKIKPAIVEIIKQRASGYCEVCGAPARESMALHHRKLRSRGGKDEVCNLLYVHHECHNLGTNSIHSRVRIATEKGWIVSSWADPADVPVTLSGGRIVILQNDGTIATIMEGD